MRLIIYIIFLFNSDTVKKVLAKLNDMFRMLVEIHEEQEEINEDYDDEIISIRMWIIWFDNMNQKVFSFKHKVHNWLKEGEKLRKSDQVSRCSSKSSSKHSSKSSANQVLHQNQGHLQRQKQLKRK